MLGVTRAVAVSVCLYPLAGVVHGQSRVDPRNSYERILMVLPLIGSGTQADPIRPSLIPAPGRGIRTLQAVSGSPQSPILGYTFALSDDGKFALTEIVMRDRTAFPAILATPGITAFIKGVNTRQQIETEFKKYKANFDSTKFGGWVR
jgi:hypothetical protein